MDNVQPLFISKTDYKKTSQEAIEAMRRIGYEMIPVPNPDRIKAVPLPISDTGLLKAVMRAVSSIGSYEQSKIMVEICKYVAKEDEAHRGVKHPVSGEEK